MILSRNFLFLVMRERESVKHKSDKKAVLAMNSLSFGGTMAVKNRESFEFLSELGPIKLLKMLSKQSE